jgi:hypothetical protein
VTKYSDSNQNSSPSGGGDKTGGVDGDKTGGSTGRAGDPHSAQRPELSRSDVRPTEQSTKADMPGGKAGSDDKSVQQHPTDKPAAQHSGDKRPSAHAGERPTLGEQVTKAMHTKAGDAQNSQVHAALNAAKNEGGVLGKIAGAADAALTGGQHIAEKIVQSAVDHTLPGRVDHVAHQSVDKTVKETTQELRQEVKGAIGALPGGSIVVGTMAASEALGKGNSLADSAVQGLDEGISHIPFASAEQHLENASRAEARGDSDKAAKEEIMAAGSFAFDVASIVVPAAGELATAATEAESLAVAEAKAAATATVTVEADTAASAEAKAATTEPPAPDTLRSPGVEPPPAPEPGTIPAETPVEKPAETPAQPAPGALPPESEPVPDTLRSPAVEAPPAQQPGTEEVPNSGIRRTEQNDSPPSEPNSQKITERPSGDPPGAPDRPPVTPHSPQPAESGVREARPTPTVDAQNGAGQPREPDPIPLPTGPELTVPEHPPVPREPDPIPLPAGPQVTVPDNLPTPREPEPLVAPATPELIVPEHAPPVPREPDSLPSPSGPELTVPEHVPTEPEPLPPPVAPDLVGPEDVPREPDPMPPESA